MDDWVFLDDEHLSNDEEEITVSCPTDPSDLVIALSSSDEREVVSSPGGSDCSSDEADDYLSDDSRNEMADDVFEPPPVVSPELEKINRIAHLVLPRLPAKSLLRFKSVSPNFNDLISSPFMVLSHFLQRKAISGLFYDDHTWNNTIFYLSFDAPSTDLPDPSLSYLPEPVTIKASTHGLLCVKGQQTLKYYITNPTTTEWVDLPQSTVDNYDDIAVVIVFDEPSVYNFSGDYRVVRVFPVEGLEGVFSFETFSSDKWAWTRSEEICEVENIVAESGTAVGAVAYWRTTMETVLSYDPVKDRSNIMLRPHSEMDEVWWELGEMNGQLSVTSQSNIGQILVSTLATTNNGEKPYWKQMGYFWLSKNVHATPIRSQGSAELVLWEEEMYARGLVLRDMQGQPVCKFEEPNYYTDFVPYISTLVPVKRSGAGTSTEPPINDNDVVLQEAIGKKGEASN